MLSLDRIIKGMLGHTVRFCITITDDQIDVYLYNPPTVISLQSEEYFPESVGLI